MGDSRIINQKPKDKVMAMLSEEMKNDCVTAVMYTSVTVTNFGGDDKNTADGSKDEWSDEEDRYLPPSDKPLFRGRGLWRPAAATIAE